MRKLPVFMLLAAMLTVSCKIGETKPEFYIVGTWMVTRYQEGESPIISEIRFEGDGSQGRAYYLETDHWYTVDGMNVHWSYFTYSYLYSYDGQFISPTVMEGTWSFRYSISGIHAEGHWKAVKIGFFFNSD